MLKDLEQIGIITSGAIIVYDRENTPIGSFIPGCYWVGATALSAAYHADYLFSLEVQPDTTRADVIAATARSLHRQLMKPAKPTLRILTALDALGEHKYGQKALGEIACVCRDTTVQTLKNLSSRGLVEKRRGFIQLTQAERGRYW